jgi:NTP pyrophosphatase (non-canonical NTP hydrolase)
MELTEYQRESTKTAIYPDRGLSSPMALAYTCLGLAGEAGELANKAKKILRDGDSDYLRSQMKDELGDCLWYIAAIANELKTTLEICGSQNIAKLEDRKLRGVLHGSGDNR